ncbi:SDR family oxidoreductase [Anaerolineales bacterium HSG6]|nr:SDR family oxidoreductase [Anaerolineales bacterium HSG6]
MELKNQIVILTGASHGIGRATAVVLAEAGYSLVLVARNQIPLQKLAQTLTQAGHRVVAIPTDMGDVAQVAGLVDKTIAIFGRIDIIINNAGIGVYSPLATLGQTDAERVMAVNYFGPVALIQATLPFLTANQQGGQIINISSIIGQRAMPNAAGYCASKAALERMSESLRLELWTNNGSHIHVSTIYPGVTATDFVPRSLGNTAELPSNRMAGVPPERVAQAILRTIQTKKRDVFITPIDWLFVTVSAVAPRLMDWLLFYYTRNRGGMKP